MSKICTSEIDKGCKRDVFDGRKECVLHCEKSAEPGLKNSDSQNERILKEFYSALREYIDEYFIKIESVDSKIYLNYGDDPEKISEFYKDEMIDFKNIFFPYLDKDDSFDSLTILKNIKKARFMNCTFIGGSLDVPDLEMSFYGCQFLKYWEIIQKNMLISERFNPFNVLYKDCTFRHNAGFYLGKITEMPFELDMSLFCDCTFKESLFMQRVKFKQPVFRDMNSSSIHELCIINCEFDKDFILNNVKINIILIIDSEFNAKVELKDGVIDEIELVNTNFNKIFDSFGTHYGKFYCSKSIFSDFVGFETCKFADLEDNEKLNTMAVFRYVTFLSFTNFRNTTFYKGLDIESINIKETPNFLNIKLEPKSINTKIETSRETLRIIKHSFDKVGNYIEANKFFALEMRKYKQDLADKPLSQEKFVFWLNEKISNFGQSYLRPIVWIVFFSVIYYPLILVYENNPPSADSFISVILDVANKVASNIIPFKNILKDGMEFVSLAFYAIYTSLIWQIIVAVKRHTRR